MLDHLLIEDTQRTVCYGHITIGEDFFCQYSEGRGERGMPSWAPGDSSHRVKAVEAREECETLRKGDRLIPEHTEQTDVYEAQNLGRKIANTPSVGSDQIN